MKFAMVFPGQGSQSIGMMRGYEGLPMIRETFTEASEVLGEDIWDWVTTGSDEDLAQTQHTQPVMLTAGVAIYRAWLALGGAKPDFLAGHSLGEYTALVAAEALSFSDALRAVQRRALLMQNQVPDGQGGMVAILGLADEKVQQLCEQAAESDILECANFNTIGQVVVAGQIQAVERVLKLATSFGAKRAIRLNMSIPSHCTLMKGAAEKLAVFLESLTFFSPRIPVLHNATVSFAKTEDSIRDALTRQLYQPVRWVATMNYFADQSVSYVVECGPGKVLSGMTKRADARLTGLGLSDVVQLQDILQMIHA
jgi:[acyl-carrier-protein] S-malonyltransferase